MNFTDISTVEAIPDEFVVQTGLKLQETTNKLMQSTQEHLNRLKSRRIALEDKMTASARQTFPNIEPYEEPINSISDTPSSSNRSSFLKLNVGGKHVDISRSTLTQIQGSKLALIFSGKWDEILPHDKDGRIFMDFDPSWMDPIFNHLRDLAIADPSARISGHISEEQPFGVIPLLNYLDLQRLQEGISVQQWKTIKSWMPNLTPAQSTPQLIFRGSRDGFTAAAFHAKCDGVPDTVTIVRDTNGSVFGGYADVAWSSSIAYVASTNSFLFSLLIYGKSDCQVSRLKTVSKGCDTCFRRMASFGSDLVVEDNCNNGFVSRAIFGQNYERLHNSLDYEEFQVAEIEVYKFSSAIPTDTSIPLTIPTATTKSLSVRWNIDVASLTLPESVQSTQSSMNELLASHHSLFDILTVIDKQYHDLEFAEAPVDDQLLFLRSYIDRMMKVKSDIESKSLDEEIIRPCDRIINFNVGGTIFTVSVGTLSQIPESMLWSGYGSGRWRAENHELDADGNIFLDHDSANFATLITLLRLKSVTDNQIFVVHDRYRVSKFEHLSRKLLSLFSTEKMISLKRYLDYFQVRFANIGMFDTSIDMSGLELFSFMTCVELATDRLSLIFRGSRDGFTAAAFHAKCDGVANTVTIVRDTNGSVFGCYCPDSWSSAPCFVHSHGYFLFSTSIRGTVNYKGCNLPKNDQKLEGDFMVAFGSSLVIAEGCNENCLSTAKFVERLKKVENVPYFLPEGSNTFQVTEIEVWRSSTEKNTLS